jgi:hypothetical protein
MTCCIIAHLSIQIVDQFLGRICLKPLGSSGAGRADDDWLAELVVFLYGFFYGPGAGEAFWEDDVVAGFEWI